jgi:hypothetical protein
MMHLDTRKSPLHLPAGRHHCPRQQEYAGLAQGEPYRGEGGVGWPPSSPDCNPFGYFVWGVSELRVNAKSHNKFKDLIQKMKEVTGPLARDTLAKDCTSFWSRIEAFFTADGSFIG